MRKTAKFYAKNSDSREKKNAYDRAYYKKNKKKANKSRAERERARVAAKKKGVSIKGKDASHTKNGKIVMEDKSKNRARNGHGDNGRLK